MANDADNATVKFNYYYNYSNDYYQLSYYY